MPRSRRSRTRASLEESQEEKEEDELKDHNDNDDNEEEDMDTKPSPKKKRSRRAVVEESEDEGEEEADSDDDRKMPATESGEAWKLSSQAPELSQDILKPRDAEVSKFLKLGEDRREKAISDVFRLVLFKSLSGESIDRLKIAKEAGINEDKITGAVFDEVNTRFDNLFGFKLKRAPVFMTRMKDFPAKCKERYYLVNDLEDPYGTNIKAIHKVHETASMEKGLLMVVLGFIFCNGTARSDGSRLLLDKELYRLLHLMDENLPDEPPGSTATAARSRNAVDGAPDVDAALDRAVKMDYLMKIKANEQLLTLNEQAEETSWFYAMGARAAIEIGRRRVVHFVSETRELLVTLVIHGPIHSYTNLNLISFLIYLVGEEISKEIMEEISQDDGDED